MAPAPTNKRKRPGSLGNLRARPKEANTSAAKPQNIPLPTNSSRMQPSHLYNILPSIAEEESLPDDNGDDDHNLQKGVKRVRFSLNLEGNSSTRSETSVNSTPEGAANNPQTEPTGSILTRFGNYIGSLLWTNQPVRPEEPPVPKPAPPTETQPSQKPANTPIWTRRSVTGAPRSNSFTPATAGNLRTRSKTTIPLASSGERINRRLNRAVPPRQSSIDAVLATFPKNWVRDSHIRSPSSNSPLVSSPLARSPFSQGLRSSASPAHVRKVSPLGFQIPLDTLTEIPVANAPVLGEAPETFPRTRPAAARAPFEHGELEEELLFGSFSGLGPGPIHFEGLQTGAAPQKNTTVSVHKQNDQTNAGTNRLLPAAGAESTTGAPVAKKAKPTNTALGGDGEKPKRFTPAPTRSTTTAPTTSQNPLPRAEAPHTSTGNGYRPRFPTLVNAGTPDGYHLVANDQCRCAYCRGLTTIPPSLASIRAEREAAQAAATKKQTQAQAFRAPGTTKIKPQTQSQTPSFTQNAQQARFPAYSLAGTKDGYHIEAPFCICAYCRGQTTTPPTEASLRAKYQATLGAPNKAPAPAPAPAPTQVPPKVNVGASNPPPSHPTPIAPTPESRRQQPAGKPSIENPPRPSQGGAQLGGQPAAPTASRATARNPAPLPPSPRPPQPKQGSAKPAASTASQSPAGKPPQKTGPKPPLPPSPPATRGLPVVAQQPKLTRQHAKAQREIDRMAKEQQDWEEQTGGWSWDAEVEDDDDDNDEEKAWGVV